MLARRIIVVSPDKAFAKQLAVASKAAGGIVDVHAGTDARAADALDGAALVVVHLDGDVASRAQALLGQLSGDTRLIAVMPRGSLAAVVELMQASDRVAGMLVAEDFAVHELAAMATRVLAGDLFGLAKLSRWGTQVHRTHVGSYADKARCIAEISAFAEELGVRRKYREAIEQCLDEMLMNALYDAPVDAHGRQLYAALPDRARLELPPEQRAIVEYACDGAQFAIAVRDVFGALERATVLRYLHKCLHEEQQIDRKAGGAGLGLYLMVSSASQVYFNVQPGAATEAVCAFDLQAPKLHLDAFGFFVTSSADADAPARAVEAAPPVAPRAAAAPTGIVAALVIAIVVTLALIAYVAVG